MARSVLGTDSEVLELDNLAGELTGPELRTLFGGEAGADAELNSGVGSQALHHQGAQRSLARLVLLMAGAFGPADLGDGRLVPVVHLLLDTHNDGLYYGDDVDTLDPLPRVEGGADVDADQVWETYDNDMIELVGRWDTDSRLYLKGYSPRPVTVLAAIIGMETSG